MSMERIKTALRAEVRDTTKTVLDVGCGFGTYLHALPPHLIKHALDAFEPYLKDVRAHVKHVGRIQDLLPLFDDEEFDLVFALDVIEHLEEAEGHTMLDQMKRIAREAVVIFTPYGYHAQEHDESGLGGDFWQKHRSGWYQGSLIPHGFQATIWEDFDYGKPEMGTRALWAVWRR